MKNNYLNYLFLLTFTLTLAACWNNEEEDEGVVSSQTTTITLDCQQELSECGNASAAANGKTGFIYYLNNNCVTYAPKTNGVDSSKVISWAKVTMSCTANGCTGSTSTWYDSNNTQISSPPASGVAGNRSFFSYIDINSSATDTDGLNGLQSTTDVVSDCSDVANTEPYGSTSLANFNNY